MDRSVTLNNTSSIPTGCNVWLMVDPECGQWLVGSRLIGLKDVVVHGGK